MKFYNIAISGEAGQGIKTSGDLLAKSLFRTGYYIHGDKSYHSRIRGGEYISRVRVSEEPCYTMVETPDLVVSLSSEITNSMEESFKESTIILADEGDKNLKGNVLQFDFKKIAKEIGNVVTMNVLIVSSILNLMDVPIDIPKEILKKKFAKKEDALNMNLKALKVGYGINLGIKKPGLQKKRRDGMVVLTGNEAAGLGAISAGCKFLSAYPMTPGSGVMIYLANKAKKYGIVVEQAEDEIAAINMAIGASFAGARAMVTTSGGGFALMEEGVSLAGMTETPLVIADAQRPGPATGLPTRTGQEDFFLTLKSGHGEFARYIVAPRTSKEAFELMEKAFYMADKYQIPTFFLMSQQLTDSEMTVVQPESNKDYNERFIIDDADENYKRFHLTESGVSPRAIPGGKAIVKVDSDEHDEEGRITEDLKIRVQMVDKRVKKEREVLNDINPPLKFNMDSDVILIGWGDSWGAIDEVCRNNKLGYMHFNELYPIKEDFLNELRGKRLISVEGNLTGHFAEYLRSLTGYEIEHIGKYDGRPICPHWLEEKLKGVDAL